jgi:hypothetical protein
MHFPVLAHLNSHVWRRKKTAVRHSELSHNQLSNLSINMKTLFQLKRVCDHHFQNAFITMFLSETGNPDGMNIPPCCACRLIHQIAKVQFSPLQASKNWVYPCIIHRLYICLYIFIYAFRSQTMLLTNGIVNSWKTAFRKQRLRRYAGSSNDVATAYSDCDSVCTQE